MLDGYAPAGRLNHSKSVLVQRCVRDSDGLPVVVKQLQSGSASYHDKARIRYEFKLLQTLAQAKVENVAVPVELVDTGTDLALVVEDIGGSSLTVLLREKKTLLLQDILHIAEQTAEALMGMHQARIIHKDLNPNNIVYNPQTRRVQVIDFGISTQIPLEMQAVDNLHKLEGTLQYISPEQTGRMNRLLDYRTDYYSLGATLYHLLSGRLPFPAAEITELVHSILAKVAQPLAEVAPKTPLPVMQIVERLMAKVPEDRYQSAFGIRQDLRKCLATLSADDNIAAFDIGRDDRSEHFAIPQKLYGRENDVRALLSTYQSIVTGRREMLLVCGPSGIGKSALVNEVQGPIVEHNGLFMNGKFDQLRRHVPFNALSQAISGVIRHLLTEPEDVLGEWRTRIQTALGNIGKALVEIVPTLELLVGKQKDIPELGPQETENRLLLGLQRLVFALCSKNPVVLFLDDLQWADLGTFKFIKMLAADDRRCAGLLLVGAYRDVEVDASHPLRGAMAEWKLGINMPMNEIVVAPMHLESVLSLVCDTTHANPVEAQPLAEVVLFKTAGNPFFVREFIKHLWQQQLLTYDGPTARWTWSTTDLRAVKVTDNVVDLMREKLRRLVPAEHRLLSTAACLGNEFKLSTLSAVSMAKRSDTLALLATSTDQGLLVPTEGNHRYALETEEDVTYKFAHDRIQQAAYELLSADEAIHNHHVIGRRLLETLDPARPEEWAFTVVNHLNKAFELIKDDAELVDLARFNLVAATEAKRSAAYPIAIHHLDCALRALGPDAWTRQYELKREVCLEIVDNQFLIGHADAANAQIEELLKETRTADEKAEVQRRRVLCMMALSQYPASLQAGIEALRLLGFELPLNPTPRDVAMARMRIEIARRGRSIPNLAFAPPMQDERIVRIMHVLSAITTPAFFANTPLLHMVVLSMGRLTILHGNSPCSAYAFSALALVYSQFNQFSVSRLWAEATRNALEKIPGSIHISSSRYFISTFIEFAWTLPRDQVDLFDELWDLHLESGAPLFAGLTAFSDLRGLVVLSVEECLGKFSKYQSFVDTKGSPQLRAWVRSTRQACLALAGRTKDPLTFDDGTFSEASEEELMKSGRVGAAAQMYYYYKTLVLWVHQDPEGACAAVERAADVQIFTKANAQTVSMFCFFAALALTALAAKKGAREVHRKDILQEALRKLRLLAAEGPNVYGGPLLLVRAELAALKGHDRRAQKLYDKAVKAVTHSGFSSYVAAANECMGRFQTRLGNSALAEVYLSRARDAYYSWGARTKVDLLRQAFPEYGATMHATYGGSIGRSTTATVTASTQRGPDGRIDLPSIMRATQALSGEVVLDRLVKRIMDSMIEVVGATRAVLLLLVRDKLAVQADSDPSQGGYPADLTQFVSRSMEALVLNNAVVTSEFKNDPYIVKVQPKSILCAPIMHQGKLQGVIFLENRLASEVFTEGRLEIVKLLAAQAATSLENAQTYAVMEERVADRTQQLREAHDKLLKMERESAEVQMAGGFAHEMRNALSSARFIIEAAFPVTGVKEGFTTHELMQASLSMFKDACAAEMPVDQLKANLANFLAEMEGHCEVYMGMAETVHHSLVRGMSITQQILDYAQIGHIQPGAEEGVKISKVVDTVLQEYRDEMASKGITTSVEVSSTLEFPIREAHAYAILRNLVDNACDALAEQPPEARRLMLKADYDYSGVALMVEDTGPGISENNKRRIFEPFFSTKGAHGTGLGLGLSRKLARIYGGNLEFTTQEERGTTFRLSLPRGASPTKS